MPEKDVCRFCKQNVDHEHGDYYLGNFVCNNCVDIIAEAGSGAINVTQHSASQKKSFCEKASPTSKNNFGILLLKLLLLTALQGLALAIVGLLVFIHNSIWNYSTELAIIMFLTGIVSFTICVVLYSFCSKDSFWA